MALTAAIPASESGIFIQLQSLRDRIEGRLSGVGHYRALLAMERTIAELAEFDDIAFGLRAIRDSIKDRLASVDEYRALCALERISEELTEVVARFGEEPQPETAPSVPALQGSAMQGGSEPPAMSPAAAELDRDSADEADPYDSWPPAASGIAYAALGHGYVAVSSVYDSPAASPPSPARTYVSDIATMPDRDRQLAPEHPAHSPVAAE